MKPLLLTLALLAAGYACARGFSKPPTDETQSNRSFISQRDVPDTGELNRPLMPHRADISALMDALQKSEEAVAQLQCYSCILNMHEAIDGRLRDPQAVEMKIHEDPFRVYMRWPETGQEALYAEGQHDGRMLVRPSGGLAAIRRLWKLNPDSRLAMKSSRYPVTDSGLRHLTSRVIAFYKNLPSLHAVKCDMQTVQCDGRLMTQFNTVFPSREISPDFAASCYQFDTKRRWLVHVENFSWESTDIPVETYSYHDLKELDPDDSTMFDHQNSQYDFVFKD